MTPGVGVRIRPGGDAPSRDTGHRCLRPGNTKVMAPPHSIGATLERRRLELRVARLTQALHRLQRISQETTAAGRDVPLALIAAERTFTEELADAAEQLAQMESTLPWSA
jgi:hypothetical protein